MSRFHTTRWSLIAEAAVDAPLRRRPALEQLCCAYRPPVLAYIRRSGHGRSDAEDLTQAFFLRFLERGWFADADPQRGRFRNLLLVSLRRFLADERARACALKRGGGRLADAEALEQLPSDSETPEQAFDRAWLGTVLARAMARLQEEWRASGRQARFDQLAPLLAGADGNALRELAESVGARGNTLAVQLHRMRGRLRQLVRLELMRTVASPESLEAELAELRCVLESAA